jgi:hypothetical protein
MKLLREPLVHFVVAGVVLFSAYSWLDGSRAAPDSVEPVRIGAGQIQWLKQTYSSQWLRPPDASELQGLVNDLVNEELFAREAQAMGLGEDDTIVRRRLAQKLKFLVEDTSRLAEPTDAELRRYFEANAARFEDSPRVSFSQIDLSGFPPRDRRDIEGSRGSTAAPVELRSGRSGFVRAQISRDEDGPGSVRRNAPRHVARSIATDFSRPGRADALGSLRAEC